VYSVSAIFQPNLNLFNIWRLDCKSLNILFINKNIERRCLEKCRVRIRPWTFWKDAGDGIPEPPDRGHGQLDAPSVDPARVCRRRAPTSGGAGFRQARG